MKSIICFSGGPDSTILLRKVMVETSEDIIVLFMNLGQANYETERKAVYKLYRKYEHGISYFEELDFSEVFTQIMERLIPYSKVHSVPSVNDKYFDDIKYIPMRFPLLMIGAGIIAEKHNAKKIYIGWVGTDHLAPDLNQDMFDGCEKMINNATPKINNLEIVAPFSKMTKTEVFNIGQDLGVDFEMTTSCFLGNKCGTCGSCTARIEALTNMKKK